MSVYLIAVIAAPAAVLLAGGRLAAGSRRSLIITVLATWLTATATMSGVDPSDIGAFFFVFLVVAPCLSIPTAAIVATRLVRARGQLVAALSLSWLGWIAGVVVLFLLAAQVAAGWPKHFWDYALLLALPAIYSACGAVVAAGLGNRAAR